VPVALPSMPALQASTTAAVATPTPTQVLYWPQPQQALPMNAPAFTTSNASMTPTPATAAMAATKPSITCYGCQQVGHIKRNCPYLQPQQPFTPTTQRLCSATSSASRFPATYITVPVCLNGKNVPCLLDTGCNQSVLPSRLLKNAELKTLDTREVPRLKAANGAQIPILGFRNVYFSINGIETSAQFAITNAIDSMILGIEWLTDHN
jgi:hypothetical protein